MAQEHMIVDLFGYVHEVLKEIPVYYFKDIGAYGAKIKCPACKTITFYPGNKRVLQKAEPTDIMNYHYIHQCQSCGGLEFSELNDPADSLEVLCDCGGQYRRDKPILCPHCRDTTEGL